LVKLYGQVAVGLQNGVPASRVFFVRALLEKELVGLAGINFVVELGDGVLAGDYHGNDTCYAGCDAKGLKKVTGIVCFSEK
jgi:hypothetical protein